MELLSFADCMVRSGAASRGIWTYLQEQPVELCFIGASVTVQRDGWCSKLLEYLRAQTGMPHSARLNAMGGVGLLFGVANYSLPSPDVIPGIAFVEFSTGDLNPGLTPLKELPGLLRGLLRKTTANYRYTVIVHNWRVDFDENSAEVRRIYDAIAAEFGLPVIHNHEMARQAIEQDPGIQAAWFRDECHTYATGADAYACHVSACLRDLDAQPASGHEACRPASGVDEPPIRFADLAGAIVVPGHNSGDFTHPVTGQRFDTVEIASGIHVRLSCSGRLMGIGFISGPRSGGVQLSVGGKAVRRFKCFDRHSHYSRYILLPCFMDLGDATTLDLVCMDEPVDRKLPAKEHPDFDLPRTMTLVHLVGAGLRVDRCSMQ